MATGCGCKEVYRFPHTTYTPIPLVSVLFYSIPTFCSFKKNFFSFMYTIFQFERNSVWLKNMASHTEFNLRGGGGTFASPR